MSLSLIGRLDLVRILVDLPMSAPARFAELSRVIAQPHDVAELGISLNRMSSRLGDIERCWRPSLP